MPAGRLSTLNVAEYGLRLRLLEEYCLVEQVVPFSAADQSGLELGDILEQIDGRPAEPDLVAIVQRIRGREGSTCQLQVLKHTGILEDLQLWRISNAMRVLLLEQIGLWVQQLPSGGFTVARVLDGKAARYSGQCAVGDMVVSISYVKPQSLDHVEELARGPDGSLLDLEIRHQGLNRTTTLAIMHSPVSFGTYGAQELVPFEAESEEAGVGVQVEPNNDGKVVVMRIEEGSPAYWSDLRVGDVITHVENSAVDSTVAFQSQTWGLLGFRVLLSVLRMNDKAPQVEHKHSIALVRARTLKREALVRANVYRNKVLQQLQDRLNTNLSTKHTGSPPPLSPVPSSSHAYTPGVLEEPAHTPITVPTLNLSALQSDHRSDSSGSSTTSSSSNTGGNEGRHGNGAGDNDLETGGWSDKIMQTEWPFEKQRRGSDEESPGTGEMKFGNKSLVIGGGSTTPPLSMEEDGTKGWRPSPSPTPTDIFLLDSARQTKELASRTPDAGIGDRNSMYAHSSRTQVPEKDILSPLYSGMHNLVDSVEEMGFQLVGDMRKQSGEERTQTLTAGSWILDTLYQTKIASSPPDNSGNVLATQRREEVGQESGIEGVVRMSQVGDEGSNGGWLVEERGRDARGTEEDAAPGGARQDVLVLNSRVTDLEGASRMLAKQVQEIVTEALVNDTKTQEDLAALQIASDRAVGAALDVSPAVRQQHQSELQPDEYQHPHQPDVHRVANRHSWRPPASRSPRNSGRVALAHTPKGEATEEGRKRFMDVMRKARENVRSRASPMTTPRGASALFSSGETEALPRQQERVQASAGDIGTYSSPEEVTGNMKHDARVIKDSKILETHALSEDDGKSVGSIHRPAQKHVTTVLKKSDEALLLGVWTEEMNDAWVSGKSETSLSIEPPPFQGQDLSETPRSDQVREIGGITANEQEAREMEELRNDQHDDLFCWPVSCILTLDLQLEEIEDTGTFKDEVVQDVACALGLNPARVRVVGLQRGSIIVDLQLNPDNYSSGKCVGAIKLKSETDLVFQLIGQSKDRGSALMRGKHTRKTISVSRPSKAYKAVPPPRLDSIKVKQDDELVLAAEGQNNLQASNGEGHRGALSRAESGEDDNGEVGLNHSRPCALRRELSPAVDRNAQTQKGVKLAVAEDEMVEMAREEHVSPEASFDAYGKTWDQANGEGKLVDLGESHKSSLYNMSKSPETSTDCDAPATPLGEIVSPRLAKPKTSLPNAAEESGRQMGGDALLIQAVKQQVMEAVKQEQSDKQHDDEEIERHIVASLPDKNLDVEAPSMTASAPRNVCSISSVPELPGEERKLPVRGIGDRPTQLHELGTRTPEIELSIGCKMASIDVMKHLIGRILDLDEAATYNTIAIMEHNPALAADEMLNTLLTHLKKDALGIPRGMTGKECSVSVRVTANFVPGASLGEIDAQGGITSRDSSPAGNKDMLWLVKGDVLVTQFCGDRGWAWGTCVRESDRNLESNVGANSKERRLGRCGWFPWDFVTVIGSPVLFRELPPALLQSLSSDGCRMALCVCGWDADRENAMSIRPGQVIQVSEFAEHWSRGHIWEDPQVVDVKKERNARWFPTKFVVALLPEAHEEPETRHGREDNAKVESNYVMDNREMSRLNGLSRQSPHLQRQPQQQQMAHDVRFHPSPAPSSRSPRASSPRPFMPMDSPFLSAAHISPPNSSPAPNVPKVQPDVLKAGLMVELHSLKGAPEHNGRKGKLVEYSESDERWHIEMYDGSVLALRTVNLRLLKDWRPALRAYAPLRSQSPVRGRSPFSSDNALPMGPVYVVGDELMPPPRDVYSENYRTQSGFSDDLPAPTSAGAVRKRVLDFEALSTPAAISSPSAAPIASTPRSQATSSPAAAALAALQNPLPPPKTKQRLPGVGPRESFSAGSAGGTWVASGAGLTEEQMRQTMSTAQSSLSESSPKFKDLRLPPRPMLAPLAGGAARREPPKKLRGLADGADSSTHKSMPIEPGTSGLTAPGRTAPLYDEDEVVNL